jgi:hypothetical protein
VTIQVVHFNLIFGAPCSDQLELAENAQSTASRVVDKVASFGRRHTTEKLRPGSWSESGVAEAPGGGGGFPELGAHRVGRGSRMRDQPGRRVGPPEKTT